MKYEAKAFTVPASGKREDPCTHGWLDPRGRCVLCGETVPTCTWCGGIEVPRPGSMHFRGRDFAALYCATCNSIRDNPADSMLAYAEACGPNWSPEP